MASAVLIPSSYYVSSSKLTVDNPENMYTNTSSTSYGVVTNTEESTSYYYFYLRGFDFDTIPSNAEVSSFTVKIRGKTSGGYNASLYLCNGTSTISGTTASGFSTSTATRTLSNGSLTWATIVSYGSNFGIRINCRRNAKKTKATWNVYGAEIDVTYTEPSETMYYKSNGSWVAASKVYKKVGGVWVEQSSLSNVFDPNVNYVKG